jgi:hypothetical protein
MKNLRKWLFFLVKFSIFMYFLGEILYFYIKKHKKHIKKLTKSPKKKRFSGLKSRIERMENPNIGFLTLLGMFYFKKWLFELFKLF